MAANSVTIRREGGIHTWVLNRPDKLNALNKDVFDDLARVIDLVETDSSARVVIIMGAGDKAFSVGADLKERQGMNEKDVLVRLEFVRQLFRRLELLSVPTIAAINGIALGGGLELALCCDFRLAAAEVTLGFPEVELGIIPGAGGTQRLARIIGTARALETIMLARRLSAQEAWQVGIVHSVCGDLSASVRKVATRLLDMGPISLKQVKSAIKRGVELGLDEGLKLEIECYKPCLYSSDRKEGLKAFAEKRKAEFTG